MKQTSTPRTLSRYYSAMNVYSSSSNADPLRGHCSVRFSDCYIQQKKKYDPSTGLMVWWVISRNGERTLVEVEGNLNADNYIKTLQENLRRH
jgi:hypothetical protein